MASKSLVNSAHLGCQAGGPSSAGSRWGQGRLPACCHPWVWVFQVVPKDHFRDLCACETLEKYKEVKRNNFTHL